ncbi:hypothetical protein HK105_203296 [Polyrhizophydium stewartii]|uniref:Uncharacterized protein n=1 Tax=Polyrhizophydium stewartii TaxID=2732419 RepID=A0ABR4NCJ4_9FUNG
MAQSFKFLRNGCAAVPPSSTRARVANVLWRRFWQARHRLRRAAPRAIGCTGVIGTLYIVADSPAMPAAAAMHAAVSCIPPFMHSRDGPCPARPPLPSPPTSGGPSPPAGERRESAASESSATSLASRFSRSSCFSASPSLWSLASESSDATARVPTAIAAATAAVSSAAAAAALAAADADKHAAGGAAACAGIAGSTDTARSSPVPMPKRPLKSCLKQQPLAIGPEWLRLLRTLRDHPELDIDSTRFCTFFTPGEAATTDLKIQFDRPGALRRDESTTVSFNWTVQQRIIVDVSSDSDTDADFEDAGTEFADGDGAVDASLEAVASDDDQGRPAPIFTFEDADGNIIGFDDAATSSEHTSPPFPVSYFIDQDATELSSPPVAAPPASFIGRRRGSIDGSEALGFDDAPTPTPRSRRPSATVWPRANSVPSGAGSAHAPAPLMPLTPVSVPSTPMTMPMTPALLKIDTDTIFMPSTADIEPHLLMPLVNATVEPSSPTRYKIKFVEAPCIPATLQEIEFGHRCLDCAFTFFEGACYDDVYGSGLSVAPELCANPAARIEQVPSHMFDAPPVAASDSAGTGTMPHSMLRGSAPSAAAAAAASTAFSAAFASTVAAFGVGAVFNQMRAAIPPGVVDPAVEDLQAARLAALTNQIAEKALEVVDTLHSVFENLEEVSRIAVGAWRSLSFF